MVRKFNFAESMPDSLVSESEISTDNSIINDSQLSELDYLKNQNNRLKLENDYFKLKINQLSEDLKDQKLKNVQNQASAEFEEEFISNKLLRKINYLRNKMDEITSFYEEEEIHLNRTLDRKMARANQKRDKYLNLNSQESVPTYYFMKSKIERLESIIKDLQEQLIQSKTEKIELTNMLETEQERLINKLCKRINHLKNSTDNFKVELKNSVSKSIDSIELDHLRSMSFDELVRFVQNLRTDLKSIQDDLNQLQPDESFAVISKCDPTNIDLWLNRNVQTENENLSQSFSSFRIN